MVWGLGVGEIANEGRPHDLSQSFKTEGRSACASDLTRTFLTTHYSASSIELSGEASITWDLQQNGNVPILRYLTLHLKSLDKFVSFSITVLDESLKTRIFKISNHRSHCVISTAQVDGEEVSICELPMEIGHSWQMCCLDLVNLCEKAFGTTKPNTLSITVNGNCRVSKVFFHKERYADAEMPAHLRCVS